MATKILLKVFYGESFTFAHVVDSQDYVEDVLTQVTDLLRSFFPNLTSKIFLATKNGTFLSPKCKISDFKHFFLSESEPTMEIMLKSLPDQSLIEHSLALPYLTNKDKYGSTEWDLRVRLAAAYRIFENFGWSEIIYNHLTVRIPGTTEFLINPFGLHFSEITASSLVKIDIEGNITDPGSTNLGINYTGYIIHGAIHKSRHDIHAVLHTHTVEGTAVSAMKFGLLPRLSQTSCIIGEPAYHDYEGLAVSPEEQATLVADLGNKRVMILRNHGLLSCGETLEEAFFRMFYLTSACKIQIAALSAGESNIQQVSDSVAKFTSEQAFGMQDKTFGIKEFKALCRLLDKQDPSYRL